MVYQDKNFLTGGSISYSKNPDIKILRLKIRDRGFVYFESVRSQTNMMDTVTSGVSCVVAKFLSFINYCLNFRQKLELPWWKTKTGELRFPVQPHKR